VLTMSDLVLCLEKTGRHNLLFSVSIDGIACG
jgi:hypothetical protein